MEWLDLLEDSRLSEWIDVRAGMRYFVGNLANYRMALEMALRSVSLKLPMMKNMACAREYEGFCMVTGMLVKMCSNIGAKRLAEWTARLEFATRQKDTETLDKDLMEYVKELERFYFEMKDVVHQWREQDRYGMDLIQMAVS